MNSNHSKGSVKERINYVKGIQGTQLDLSDLGLYSIPDEIGDLRSLIHLNLRNNELVSLPNSIGKLMNLSTLDVSYNKLKALPSGIGNNSNLTKLFLQQNQLSKLPNSLKNARRLNVLNISNNNFIDLPQWIFGFDEIKKVESKKDYYLTSSYRDDFGKLSLIGNPLESPPLEILEQGLDSIFNYFDEVKEKSKFLFESKLIIVGEPGAGKTTLAKKIINPECSMPESDETTRGIDIFSVKFKIKGNQDFRMNIWDFGGQEIYKATHQFFLTKRSLYVLLSDNRAENTDFNYWLQTIEILSDNSPVIIVQNEKQGRKLELNENAMRGVFSNLIKVMQTNLLDGEGLSDIKNEIEYQLQSLKHIGKQLPKTWIDIRQDIEEIAITSDFIELFEYYQICKKNGIESNAKCNFLSSYLHDLGVFLHFQENPILKNIVILNSKWVTDAVYRVLDNDVVIKNKGFFLKSDLENIWDEDKYKDRLEELLELMIKFELCYKIPNTTKFILPQLLTINQPKYEWGNEESLNIVYVYEFMPKGIITRFIVRLHHLIENNNLVWKQGVILCREGARAEIIESYGKYEIRIKVSGNNSKELLTVITQNLDEINNIFDRIKVEKLIPCICEECKDSVEPHHYKYSNVKRRKEKGKRKIECEKSLETVNILKLIEEFVTVDYSKEYLLNLISENRWKELFIKMFDSTKSIIVYDDILILSSRYNKLSSDLHKGFISYEKNDIELNKIRKSLIEIIKLF